jgi:hypothetical protein
VKLVIDMNLSPGWVSLLQEHTFQAVHWSSTGALNAEDAEIMQWARDNQAVVFTHDLDSVLFWRSPGPVVPASFRRELRTSLRRTLARESFQYSARIVSLSQAAH